MPESSVIQQEEGQAFWIYHGRAQHVQTAMVPITPEPVAYGWQEICRQEEMQRQLSEAEDAHWNAQRGQKKAEVPTDVNNKPQSDITLRTQQKLPSTTTPKKKGSGKRTPQHPEKAEPDNLHSVLGQKIPSTSGVDDDEPDRL